SWEPPPTAAPDAAWVRAPPAAAPVPLLPRKNTADFAASSASRTRASRSACAASLYPGVPFACPRCCACRMAGPRSPGRGGPSCGGARNASDSGSTLGGSGGVACDDSCASISALLVCGHAIRALDAHDLSLAGPQAQFGRAEEPIDDVVRRTEPIVHELPIAL